MTTLEHLRLELREAEAAGDEAALLDATRRILAAMNPAQQRAAAARLKLAMEKARPC